MLSGCVTQDDLVYMQTKDKNILAYTVADIAEYKLKPGDELYININSLDEAANDVFANSQVRGLAGQTNPYGASLLSYTIDKQGFLLLPIIGNVLIKDKTITQLSQILRDSLANILSQPIVNVKLVNRYVSVLGEVKVPGHYIFAQEKLTIYDALGLAGDITLFGNRKDIVLSRNENGKNLLIRIDLTKPEILASNYYYLRPNDMVYVKPLKKRFWNMGQFPYALILSTITTALLIYSFVD